VRAAGVFFGVIVPAIAAICDVLLLINLDGNAKLLGLVWLAIGIGYLTILTGFFRKSPPEMVFEENAN
jgi:hypothetical protein